MVKNPPANTGGTGSIPELGRSHREGNGNPLQYSCLENPMDGEAWWVSVHGITRVRHDLVTQPPYTSNIIALLGKKKNSNSVHRFHFMI